ncbi:MAG: CIA30 family protein [bacterium]|nr:CIA30 family protein [bacterium]MDT8365135.1 CIA30 family protein [bacterium]
MLLFDFTDPETADLFHPIGDSVMGGVSSGALNSEGGYAVFSGEVSFQNQGGFASVRSEPGSWNLSEYDDLQLEVLSDGKTYKLSLTTDSHYDSVVYRARFNPPAGEWLNVRIPFTDLIPTFRGEKVSDAPPLDRSTINSFGLLISDRQEGPFHLEIKSIRAF